MWQAAAWFIVCEQCVALPLQLQQVVITSFSTYSKKKKKKLIIFMTFAFGFIQEPKEDMQILLDFCTNYWLSLESWSGLSLSSL